MPVSGGSASKTLSRASNPPAEAPRPTTRKSSGRDRASRCREAPRPGRSRAFSAPRGRASIVMDFGFPRYCALLFAGASWVSSWSCSRCVLNRLLEVLAEDPVQLLMQLDDLDLGLQIDLIIQAGGQTVARRLAVLGHQDDRSLQRGQHGKNEVEEDIGVGIEWFDLPCPDDAVESGPGDQRDETHRYKRPGPVE